MGIKGETRQKPKPVATAEQLRLAKLTLEGKSTDEEPNYQKLIKMVIETTQCTSAQAEIALYDNDNNVIEAIDQILEKGPEVDSWTEQKSKKDKKKEEEDKSRRGHGSGRGRAVFVERGRGRSVGGPSRSNGERDSNKERLNGHTMKENSSARGGRGGSRANPTRSQTESTAKPVEIDLINEESDWKSGPMEFKRSENLPPATTSSLSVSATISSTSSGSVANSSASSSMPATSAPFSFAAVAAGAAKKEQLKKEQQQQASTSAVAPSSSSAVQRNADDDYGEYAEPEQSEKADNNDVHEESYTSEPSVVENLEAEESLSSIRDQSSVLTALPPSPTLQVANAQWTNQLKNDLGIGLPSNISAQYSTSPSAPVPVGGVEFAAGAAATGLDDYQFGFVDVPPTRMEPSVSSPSTAAATSPETLFNNSRHSAATVAPLKTAEPTLANGDFNRTSNSPGTNFIQSNSRSLGFGEAVSVSFNPNQNSERIGTSKAQPQQQSHPPQQSQAQQQQSHQQQPMFAPHLPYTFPYMNMYSPVAAGVRADDPYSAALMQYPFSMNMDLSNILPNTVMNQAVSGQQLPNQHRSDSHIDGMKYQGQNNREPGQQPSTVAPPPGFANPSFMHQPQLSSLFMPPQYPHHGYSFMMPNVGSAGRQVYSHEEERKSYDKMAGAKQAQATPPPHFPNQGYLNMNIGAGINKKPYNWSNNN